MSGGNDPRELSTWQRIRGYAVPRWMIDECTAARERGDWRAACETAMVDVAFDTAGPLRDTLAGFAPDLLRWHLPRALGGSTALATGKRYVLAPDGPVDPGTMVLLVHSPSAESGSERLTLDAIRFGDIRPGPLFPLAPHLWDVRRAPLLRAAANGSAARLPGFTPAGDPLPAGEHGIGDDMPALAERITAAPGAAEAWAMTAWQLGTGRRGALSWDLGHVYRIDPLVAARELRRVAAQFGRRSWLLPHEWLAGRVSLEVHGDLLRAVGPSGGSASDGPPEVSLSLHPALLRSPVDLELVRHGLISPAELHPLVCAALFPAVMTATLPSRPPLPAGSAPPDPDVLSPGGGPADRAVRSVPGPPGLSPASGSSIVPDGFLEESLVRVRCRGAWHGITMRAGRLGLLEHTEQESQRERALAAFGGTMGGCFRADLAWHGGDARLPRQLRQYRNDLLLRLRHGGARAVSELLDAGLNPHLRDRGGRTLLHMLGAFGDPGLVPRLLAAGLDVDTRDRQGWTPLYEAVHHRWPAPLIIALADAGADPGEPVKALPIFRRLWSTPEEDLNPDFVAAIAYLKERA